MTKATTSRWGKVVLLTIVLYGLLAYPSFSADLGLSWTKSLFLEFVQVPADPRHGGFFALSLWKASVVAGLAGLYALGVVAWVRERQGARPALLATFGIFVVAIMFIALLNWADLAFALRDRNAVWPNSVSKRLVELALWFPGGMLAQALVSILLQVLLTVGLVNSFLLPKQPGQAVNRSNRRPPRHGENR